MKKRIAAIALIVIISLLSAPFTVLADENLTNNEETTKQYDVYDAVSQSNTIIDEDGIFNGVHKIADNVIITINYNNELALIAAAVGSNFAHKRYVSDPDREITGRVQQYFREFTDLEYAKGFLDTCIPENVYGIRFLNGQLDILSNIKIFDNLFDLDLKYDLLGSKLTNYDNLLRGFCTATDAKAFFRQNSTYYKELFNKYIQNYGFNHVKRIENFFGTDLSNEEFVIYLSGTEHGGSAMEREKTDDSISHVVVLSPSFNEASDLMYIYHETTHNFLNPILKKYSNLIMEYEKYSSVLKKHGEAGFRHSLSETVTMAITGILLKTHHGEEMGVNDVKRKVNTGWINTDKIYQYIEKEYLGNKDKYGSFEAFFPKLLEHLKELDENPVPTGEFIPLYMQKYGISDIDAYEKRFVFCDTEWRKFKDEIHDDDLKIDEILSLYYLTEKYLQGNNLIIISADENYDKLPQFIKGGISKVNYNSIDEQDEFKMFEAGEATVLIVKKNKTQ